MKSPLRFFFFVLAFSLFVSGSLLAQNGPKAYLSSDAGISLTTSSPLVGTYHIDISDFEWTEEKAQQAANDLDEQSELISLELDFPNLKFILTLDLNADEAEGWGLNEWNNHLSTIHQQ